MTTPSDPNDPLDPTGELPALDGTEAALRDALDARAAAVEPTRDDPVWLEQSIAADRAARLRRNRTVLGVAAAALVLVAVGLVATLNDDDPNRVITGSDDSTTTLPVATTDDTVGTTDSLPTTATTETTVATTTTTTAPPTTTTTTAPPLPGATTDPKSGPRVGNVVAELVDLRIGCNPGYDRVVLEFADGIIPEWSVQYVEPPIASDGSGDTVAVAGSAFLQVRMDGAVGHDQETFEPTYPGPDRIPGCGSVTEVVDTGEFEAIFVWTIGLDSKVPFTATTLSGPARIVIDIATS